VLASWTTPIRYPASDATEISSASELDDPPENLVSVSTTMSNNRECGGAAPVLTGRRSYRAFARPHADLNVSLPVVNSADASAPAGPSQKTTGWRAVFSLAPVYRFAQTAIGADRVRTVLTDEFIRATPDDRIVDFGCGTADVLDHLPECDYVGVDASQRYIDDARSRYGDRGTFVTSAAERFDGVAPDRTIAIAIGVLHHLDDDAASEMLRIASQTLEAGGRFVSIDPSLVEGQHPMAKLLVSRDRGQHVRTPEAQTELVRRWFPDADIVVRHDLLRTPYSHVIVSATAAQRS
jgi:SAM-dependent methyltransferase